MLHHPTISRNAALEPELDHARLFGLGLDHIRRLAHRLWTDYNDHDPGITTLELAAYALTDLGYRASLPLEDLLAAPKNAQRDPSRQFFTAQDILPNHALTGLDYRKLLIDVEGVHNAWVIPAQRPIPTTVASAPVVPLAGLYHVFIEFTDDCADRDRALEKVKETLGAHRNLCEDFLEPTPVPEQRFDLRCEIELSAAADPAQVAVEVPSRVRECLAPSLTRYTLKEMRRRDRTDGSPSSLAEIFEGPKLDHGFIVDEELVEADRRDRVPLSEIVSALMRIPGVSVIRSLVIQPVDTDTPPGASGEPPSSLGLQAAVTLKPDHKAVLNHPEVRLYRQGLCLTSGRVHGEFDQARPERRKEADAPAGAEDLSVPGGRYRFPADYVSFQTHFPAIYGLNDTRLGEANDERRRRLVLQFKAYLLFFDQVMANYLAQLSHARDLFAIPAPDWSGHPPDSRTYFCQSVDGDPERKHLPDLDQLWRRNDPAQTMAVELETQTVAQDRRRRFIDHLLARVAEDLGGYHAVMTSVFRTEPWKILKTKSDFLYHYDALSRERGLGHDLAAQRREEGAGRIPSSGFERSLAARLGIRPRAHPLLAAVDLAKSAKIFEAKGGAFGFRLHGADPTEFVVVSEHEYATRAEAEASARLGIERALRGDSYRRHSPASNRHYFSIHAHGGEGLARSVRDYESLEAMDADRRRFMSELGLDQGHEGLYAIELILLRPETPEDPLLPACLGPSATASTASDEYSYRVRVLLPGYGPRFGNLDFRRFAEQVIRAETPAHILPTVCWINRAKMKAFESAYFEWLGAKDRATPASRARALAALYRTLFEARNTYPQQRLHSPAPGDDRPTFRLGHSALGSDETEDGPAAPT